MNPTAEQHPDVPVLERIERRAARYARQRAELLDLLHRIEQQQRRLIDQHLGQIRSLLAETAAAEDDLRRLVEGHPECFAKPRTRIFHGIKVGLQKGKGKVEIPDEAKTLRFIREKLPEEQAELLIKVTERVDRRMVADLTAADLKRLGIRLVESGDQVVIKPVDSDLDKLVKALLSNIDIEEEAA